MLVTRGHEAINRGMARHTGGQGPKVRRESPRLASPSVSSVVSSLVLQLPGSLVGDKQEHRNNCMRVVGKTLMAPQPCITQHRSDPRRHTVIRSLRIRRTTRPHIDLPQGWTSKLILVVYSPPSYSCVLCQNTHHASTIAFDSPLNRPFSRHHHLLAGEFTDLASSRYDCQLILIWPIPHLIISCPLTVPVTWTHRLYRILVQTTLCIAIVL
jgi:hypothetical protein